MAPFAQAAQKRTDQGDYWWELRACDYYYEFDKPKIMYQAFQVSPCFVYDEQGLFCNNSMWILPGANKYLLGILNSSIGWFLVSQFCTPIQNGFQLIFAYMKQLPIPPATAEQQAPIVALVEQVLAAKAAGQPTDQLETQIDSLVAALYGLSPAEAAQLV